MNLVQVAEEGAVTVVTLDRPARHNSLVPELLEDLVTAFQSIRTAAGAVVLQAEGSSFSTGGDVRGFFKATDLPGYAATTVGLLNDVILAMVGLAQPIVTAVQGPVTGGSLGLVLASDVVLLAPEASFTPWYSAVGFSPDGGWTAMLPAVIGRRRTTEILMANRTISADLAFAWGLATAVRPASRLRREALATAHHIAEGAAGSVRRTKRLLNADLSELAAALEIERQQFVEQVVTAEAHDGMQRYLERR